MATTDIHTHQDVHHHDDHEEHEHHEGNFWTKYIFSQDHKVIAKQFLITGIFWALLGGILSVIFRLQLGFPDMNLEWLKPVLGEWITAEGKLDPEFYLASGNDARNDHGVLCAYCRAERNILQLPYSVASRSARYGFGILEHAFVLVLFPFQRDHVYFPLSFNRTRRRWMDNLSSVERTYPGH